MRKDKNNGKLINPVPDIIPSDIWNNLPDALKEEIIKGEGRKNNHSDYRFNIYYDPDEDTISIHSGSGTVSHTDTYDVKRGVFKPCTASYGL